MAGAGRPPSEAIPTWFSSRMLELGLNDIDEWEGIPGARGIVDGMGTGGGGLGFGASPGAASTSLTREMGPQTRPGFQGFVHGGMPASASPQGVAGNAFPQFTSGTGVGREVGGLESLPAPDSLASIIGVRTLPAGMDQPAGGVVSGNYAQPPPMGGLPNLRTLQRKAGV